MLAHYISPQNQREAERELDDAFEPDNDDEDASPESSMTSRVGTQDIRLIAADSNSTNSVPGSYDFERDYDCPPPGSPPLPSAVALPNDYGNSNGQMPTTPAHVPASRLSFFRRAVGSVLPTHYTSISIEPQLLRTRGGGIENDGVFTNVTAKPQRTEENRTADEDTRIAPENVQADAPPVSPSSCYILLKS